MSSNTKTGSRAASRTRSGFSLTQPECDVIPVIFVGCGPIRPFAESEDNMLLTLKVLDESIHEEGSGTDVIVSEVKGSGAEMDCRVLGSGFGHFD